MHEAFLRSLMTKNGFCETLYDEIRLIDPVTQSVLSQLNAGGEHAADTDAKCYEVFGLKKPCANCAAIMAIQKKEQTVSIDYVNGGIYITIAQPVFHENTWLVLEIYKNITKSGIIGVDGHEAVPMNQLLKSKNSIVFKDLISRIYKDNYIDTRLPSDLFRVQAEDRKLSLFIVSIQSLKEINELYGTDAGDGILREYSSVLGGFCKNDSDWSTRFTGSEFIVVMFHLSQSQTQQVCKQIYEKLMKIKGPRKDTALKIVFSLGFYFLEGKAISTQEIISAARRNTYYPATDKTDIQRAEFLRKAFPNTLFSWRENEVASLLLSGKSNQEISQTLFISLSTVKKHIASIYEKTEVKSRGKFIAKAKI